MDGPFTKLNKFNFLDKLLLLHIQSCADAKINDLK